jgi:peptidoglycan hydrolase-like protein with peptidoglycan-binding domain
MRRLREAPADQLPKISRGVWANADGHPETIFEANFAATTATPPGLGGADIRELEKLLQNLGYLPAGTLPDETFDTRTTLALKQFQYVNELTVNGLLDNPTLNRLLNLSYDPNPEKGGMKLAKPSSPAALAGFDANRT